MKTFLKEFLKYPKVVGTGLPCFNTLVKNLISNIDFSKDLFIVELGPGEGNFLDSLLNNITKDSKIYSFEINQTFFDKCKNKFSDNRLFLFNESGENFSKFIDNYPDIIICGIPLSSLEDENIHKILRESYNNLKDDGLFFQYKYFSNTKNYINNYFNIKKEKRVYFHIPPAIYYKCTKK